MNLNPQTGMPELPVGYFWRVKRIGSREYLDRLYVQLRRRVGPFSVAVRTVMASQSSVYGPTIQHAIRARAQHILESQSITEPLSFLAVLGDYPPKKLDIAERYRNESH